MAETTVSDLVLTDHSKVAVIGSGPAGSFFGIFILDLAKRIDIELKLDIFESRDFSVPGPVGCNMCGGIISEFLVQILATEGIELPSSVIQRGIEGYTLYMDVGNVQIKTPMEEKRIGAVYRGTGPKGVRDVTWESFDAFLQNLASKRGASIISSRIDGISWKDGRPAIRTKEGRYEVYDLLAVATGVNSSFINLFSESGSGYEPPRTIKTFICEFYLGREKLEDYLGNTMHTYLLNIPNLEFAAIIPKGDYATVCMLGREINKEIVLSFMENTSVRKLLPQGWEFEKKACQCMPRMNISGSPRPYGNRVVFIGDCGVSRLYKDGIGAAYRTAKAAAVTAIFNGISEKAFEKRYGQVCKKLERDNSIGKFIFFTVRQILKIKLARRAILRMVGKEQTMEKNQPRMSMVLWDMFTGSAPYKDILYRTFHPLFWGGLVWNTVVEACTRRRANEENKKDERTGQNL